MTYRLLGKGKKLISYWALLLFAAVSLFPLAGEAAEGKPSKQPIKIGVVFPLSGAAGESGQNLLKGFNLYVDQVHHKMGGRPVELIVENTEGSAAMAVAKVHK